MAPHSSTLAWKIPWMEEPGGLPSMGSHRVGHDWVTSLSLFTVMHWRRKWQPTSVFLPGESQGRGSLVGCRLWGRTESDMTERRHSVTQEQRPMGGGVSRLNVFCPFLNWSFSNERKCLNVFCPFLIGIFQMPLSDIWFANIFPSL